MYKTAQPGTKRPYSSHQESIGKALSSPGIRFNNKTHITCDSSARMAELVRSMAGFSTYGRFFYIARAALNPPTSLCHEVVPGDPIQPTVAENALYR
ncbi:hypothetical protein [Absidia glauca]|uniref:Ndc10 domain-containing protein n=1 Tax=Absidia glauca TaxID=4829 RepID=A0A168R5N1_ABSGL|nr:hypothetical protein [Absidia glauca]